MDISATELVFILDKSGSMNGLEKDSIGGYNAMLEKQKAQPGECLITTVLFNHRHELLHDRVDIRAVAPLGTKDYVVGGNTALLDAMGMAIEKILQAQSMNLAQRRAKRVLFVIITDGEENASRKHRVQEIRQMIDRQRAIEGWEFIFLGANIDAVETGGRYGIGADRALDYVPDAEGTRLNYAAVSDAILGFREAGNVPEAFLQTIREDMKCRGRRR